MKRLFWLGIVFLSVSWLFILPIFRTPNYNLGVIFLIIGIIFNILAFWKHDFKKIDKKYMLAIIPLLISLLIIPFPFNLGPIILMIGLLLLAINMHFCIIKKTKWIFLGISFSGIVLTIQSLFLPIYATFISHGHRVDFLSTFVSSTGEMLGLSTSVNDGIVFVQTLDKTYPFTTTWEKLGFLPWFNILIGACILFFLLPSFKKAGKYVIGFLLFSAAYLLLRYVLLISIYTQVTDITLFWDMFFVAISYIPFALLLMRFAPLKDLDLSLDCFKELKINKKKAVATFLIFIFVFSIVGAFVFQDPGTEKKGRILIDEFHSNWENSAQELDKEWYGMDSTYNYYCWAEWLDKYYTVDRNIDNYLTSDLLSNYDILILKCPTDLYSDEEINDIVQFVKNGGGLYLIGDHTNVFGMNFYLNLVSEKFGITFNTDATHEIKTGRPSIYKPDPIFSHVIVQNMEQFEYLTSCTLTAPITSENVMIGNRLFGEPGTYSTENFFRETIGSPDLEYGLLLQVAAVKHEKGRVLAFTDSTCFSNFCIFMDGYQDFNLGAMEYLNRVNKYSYLNSVFMGIAIISLVLSIIILRRERKIMILFLFIIIGILSFSTATPLFSHLNNINYQLPSARADYNKIAFETEHSSAKIAHLLSSYRYESNEVYSTFYVWTQRVNCIPSLEKTLEDAINTGDVVVIINPTKSFEEKDIEAIKDYIAEGGRILLMDSALNTDSTSNQLLKDFNISLVYESTNNMLYKFNDTVIGLLNESEFQNNSNLSIGNMSTPYLTIKGGEDVFITEKNETQIAVVNQGKGKIVVVVDSFTFSDEIMGDTFTEPDEALRQIYNTEFYIFEELLLKK